MNAGKAIYYLLSNASSVTDICGTRIYPELAEQEAPTPFVVYEVISVDPDDTNDGPAKMDEVSVDITAVADSYDACADLASAIRSAIDRVRGTYNGVNVDSIQYSTTDTDVFDSPRRYAMTAGFIIRISRDDAQIATGQPIDLLTILRLADTPSTYGTEGQALVMNAAGNALEWGETASALGSLTDVNLDDLQDHEALVYDQDTATWINGASTKIGIRVINTGLPLLRGCPVRATGVQGDQVIVAHFNASQHDPKTFIGLLSENVNNGATGYARQTGTIYQLNTSAFEIGDILYPKGGVFFSNGFDSMTTDVPAAPNAKIPCAIVLRKHANTGRVYVRTWTPSRKIEDMDDVGPLILPQFREGKSLVWNIDKWISGSPKLNMSELLDVQTYNPVTIPNKQTLRWSSLELEWQVIPEVGGLPTTPNVITYFLGRYNDEASTARQAADATLTIEHYLSVQADGHGEEISTQSDTPTSGNKIVRKIWHKAVSFEDSDVTTWTLVHTFADDTAYADTTATFDALLTAATYGSIPFTLAQTWEDAPAFSGLLDTYSGAAAAYSLRLLDSTYTGDAIRVRRASDNAEQDIEFVDNELHTSALATFCAGTDGFVKTWYDQSGNGDDLAQTSTSAQPKIYDASTGVIVDANGKPRAIGQSESAYLQGGPVISGDVWIFTTLQTGQAAAVDYEMLASGDASKYILAANSGSTSTTIFSQCTANALYKNGASWSPANRGAVWSDLNSAPTLVSLDLTPSNTPWPALVLGYAGSSALGMHIAQEFILYPSDQSANRTGIETNINDHFSIYGQSPTGFLADYPGAAAAYSLRQLISTATYAVAVRRDSDDAVLPIGFVDGELDTTTLAAFCSGTDGFVAVWFDQSGEGNHATQTTTSLQPKIYDASTGVVTDNGKPSMLATGARLEATGVAVSGAFGSVAVANIDTTTTSALWAILDAFNDGPEVLAVGNNTLRYAVDSNDTNLTELTRQMSIFASYDGTTKTYSVDGSSQAVSVTTTCNASGLEIGYRVSGNSYTGYMQEIVIWSADQSSNRAGIETNINDHYTIY
jgi:hypothetical protein